MGRVLNALPEGTNIAGYVLGRVLGRGGFGITYFACQELDPTKKFAIKEFLPDFLAERRPGQPLVRPKTPETKAGFEHGLAKFKDEARTLVKLRHPNIVEMLHYFEQNGTGYLLMKHEEGKSLFDILVRGQPLDAAEIMDILPPLLNAVEAVHARNYIHRDIKPGNIYLRREDGSPVLLDFGAAREVVGAAGAAYLTKIRTPRYAPYEQCSDDGSEGPWTDIYALGATLYCCMTGAPPPDATERKTRDRMVPATVCGKGKFPERLLDALDAALALEPNKRPSSVAALREMIGLPAEARSASTGPARELVKSFEAHLLAEVKRRRFWKRIAYASAAVLALAGGGAAAVVIDWRDDDRIVAEMNGHLEKAGDAMRTRDWAAARRAIIEAKRLRPADLRVGAAERDLASRVKAEFDAHLKNSQELLRQAKFDDAENVLHLAAEIGAANAVEGAEHQIASARRRLETARQRYEEVRRRSETNAQRAREEQRLAQTNGNLATLARNQAQRYAVCAADAAKRAVEGAKQGSQASGHYSGRTQHGDYQGQVGAQQTQGAGHIVDGCGIMTYSAGGRYEGQWRNGYWSGYGRSTTSSYVYEGEVASSPQRAEGYGVYRYTDNGDEVQAQFKLGTMVGAGIWTNREKLRYEGQILGRRPHGYGVMTLPDRRTVEAEFVNGAANGYGVWTEPSSGKRSVGRWEDGVFKGHE